MPIGEHLNEAGEFVSDSQGQGRANRWILSTRRPRRLTHD